MSNRMLPWRNPDHGPPAPVDADPSQGPTRGHTTPMDGSGPAPGGLARPGAANPESRTDDSPRDIDSHRMQAAMTDDEPRVEAASRSRKADERWARFLSGFVHDLKTPLASLSVITELLDRDQESRLSEKEARYTVNLRELAREMQVLVNDVGTLARLHGGKVQIRREPVSLSELARRATESARGHGWERGVSLSTTLDPDLPSMIRTDPGLLDEALAGLLETAIALADKEVSFRMALADPGTGITFTVAPDRGCAPGQDPESLFDPFAGGTSRTLKQKGGRPMAPLLAREIFRALGGDMEVVPDGEGTKCVVGLQLNDPGS